MRVDREEGKSLEAQKRRPAVYALYIISLDIYHRILFQ